MYQQRAEPESEAFAPIGPWQPSLRFDDEHEEHLVAAAGATYVVIDEIIADRARLVVAPWPTVDASGRLTFEQEASIPPKTFRLGVLEKTLNRHRRRVMQTERGLRVGDVFFVRVFDEVAVTRWRGVVDVTSEARPVTKSAFLRAVAQHPVPPPLQDLRSEGEELPSALAGEPSPSPAAPEAPAPKGSTANPAV